jgi:uncharacterized protein YxeA
MKNILKSITMVLVIATTSLYAGAGTGHSHGATYQQKITKDRAKVIAKSMIKGLINRGTIDTSWQNKDIIDVEYKSFGNSKEWVVSFENKELTDSSKQRLYVFVNSYGKVTGANYTGN